MASENAISEFLELHLAALEANEARHNRLLAALQWAEVKRREFNAWSLGAPGQCALMTSPGGQIVLGDADEQQCRGLAEETLGLDYRTVEGPDQTATWFCQRAVELGATFADPSLQRIHALCERPVYPGTPGHARLAELGDADIVTAWVVEFSGQAWPYGTPPSRSACERDLREGRVLFWVADEEPASMAAIVRRTRHAAAISLVYTPPPLRNRGYAGAAVAALVDRIYAEGRTTACLYADVKNPISNRCYAKIGFRPVCDAAFYAKR